MCPPGLNGPGVGELVLGLLIVQLELVSTVQLIMLLMQELP